MSTSSSRTDGHYISDGKKYANDALNELVVLIHTIRNADRKRMRFIGLIHVNLSEKYFKHLAKALAS